MRQSRSEPSSWIVLQSLFALLGLELPDVKLELFAFEDVSVGTTDLTGAGGNGGENTTSLELLLQ